MKKAIRFSERMGNRYSELRTAYCKMNFLIIWRNEVSKGFSVANTEVQRNIWPHCNIKSSRTRNDWRSCRSVFSVNHEETSVVWKDNLFHYTHDLMTSWYIENQWLLGVLMWMPSNQILWKRGTDYMKEQKHSYSQRIGKTTFIVNVK